MSEESKSFYPEMGEAKKIDPLTYEGPEWDTVEIRNYDRLANKRTGPEPITYARIPMRLHNAVTRDVDDWYGEEPFGEFRDLVSQLEEQKALDGNALRNLKTLAEDGRNARRREQKEEIAQRIKNYVGSLEMGKRQG